MKGLNRIKKDTQKGRIKEERKGDRLEGRMKTEGMEEERKEGPGQAYSICYIHIATIPAFTHPVVRVPLLTYDSSDASHDEL